MLKWYSMLWCSVIAMAFGKCPSAPGSLLLFTTPWSTAQSHNDAVEGNKNSHVAANLIWAYLILSFGLTYLNCIKLFDNGFR